jgi:hypothetical protein
VIHIETYGKGIFPISRKEEDWNNTLKCEEKNFGGTRLWTRVLAIAMRI